MDTVRDRRRQDGRDHRTCNMLSVDCVTAESTMLVIVAAAAAEDDRHSVDIEWSPIDSVV